MSLDFHALPANNLIVFDFETTGLSPDLGDRAIEIGAVLIQDGKITERFQRVMNPGIPVPLFIENLTGITNAMIKGATNNAAVMAEFHDFIAGNNLVAHNASFDERFLRAEFRRIKKNYASGIACSLLAARRILQSAPNHQLATLAQYKNLPTDGAYHRALADAEVTAHLWLSLLEELREQHELNELSFGFMHNLTKTPKHQLRQFYAKHKVNIAALG